MKYKKNSTERVVITGIGVISPNGIGIDKFWKAIKNGKSGLKTYSWGKTKFNFKNEVYGEVRSKLNIEPYYYTNYQSRYLDFIHTTAAMAIKDSKINLNNIDNEKCGVIIGSAIADAKSMEYCLINKDIKKDFNSDFFSLDFGIGAASLSYKYNAQALSLNISTGCVAGVDAVGMAMEKIRYGDCEVVIAGSCDTPLCPLSIGSFEALGALSKCTITPKEKASCPFSKERDGFVIAEGCGIFILESLKHAKKRNAKIYAEIVGYASVNNAYHMTNLHSEGLDMAKCIELAIENSTCNDNDINHISAHGSSTKQNDINETAAIKHYFKERAYKIPINSLKSMTGHALSAANSLEIAALCKEIQEKYLYPTINYENMDPNCDLDYVTNVGRSYNIKAALKLSSGFSGIHSAIIIKEYKNG